jgi:hypothetical protein
MALMAALSTASFAADFNGKLMDATCVDQNQSGASKSPSTSTESGAASSTASSSKASCDATSATTAFAIEAKGKTYKLDSTGNSKAAEALKSRADRSANPGATPQSYTAKVSGKESSGTISVESIDIQ